MSKGMSQEEVTVEKVFLNNLEEDIVYLIKKIEGYSISCIKPSVPDKYLVFDGDEEIKEYANLLDNHTIQFHIEGYTEIKECNINIGVLTETPFAIFKCP